MTPLSIILFITFFALSLIHFNWALGGTWGFDNALPTNEKGERILNPRKIDSAIVGFGLAAFGLFYLHAAGGLAFNLPAWMVNYLGWGISFIFLLRAVGDFNYVGFFKKVKNTNFGKMDSKVFSPLCLSIAFIGILIEILK